MLSSNALLSKDWPEKVANKPSKQLALTTEIIYIRLTNRTKIENQPASLDKSGSPVSLANFTQRRAERIVKGRLGEPTNHSKRSPSRRLSGHKIRTTGPIAPAAPLSCVLSSRDQVPMLLYSCQMASHTQTPSPINDRFFSNSLSL